MMGDDGNNKTIGRLDFWDCFTAFGLGAIAALGVIGLIMFFSRCSCEAYITTNTTASQSEFWQQVKDDQREDLRVERLRQYDNNWWCLERQQRVYKQELELERRRGQPYRPILPYELWR